jgi:hypothetical protein
MKAFVVCAAYKTMPRMPLLKFGILVAARVVKELAWCVWRG